MSSFSTNGREKITIWEDGHTQVYNTPTKGKAAIAEIWAPSPDDFNSYVYLDSRVPHPLVRGTSSQRKAFFTSFFGLNRIDAERKVFSAELQELLKTKQAYVELGKTLKNLTSDLMTPEQVGEMRDRYAKIKAKVTRLQELSVRAQEVKSIYDLGTYVYENVKAQGLDMPELSASTFSELAEKAAADLQEAKRELDRAQEWDQYIQDRREYVSALASLPLDEGDDPQAYIRGHRNYKKYHDQAISIKLELERLVEVDKPRPQDKPESDYEELVAERANLRAQLEHSHKFGSGKCHVCGQSVAVKDPRKLERRLDTITKALEDHARYQRYQSAKVKYLEYRTKSQELKEQLDKYNRACAKFKTHFQAFEGLRSLVEPERPGGEFIKLKVAKLRLDEAQKQARLYEFLTPHLESILAFNELTDSDLRLRKFDTSRLVSLQELQANRRAKLELHASVRAKAKEIQARMQEMEVELANEEPLRLLIKGYSDKAMKKMAIEAICSRLVGLLNHHGQPYLPGFVFEFQWNTQLAILAHRPNGDVSDVRKLSGAESLLFTLVLVMALSAFVPSRKKVSTLILDEPSASFSAETTRIFMKCCQTLTGSFPRS